MTYSGEVIHGDGEGRRLGYPTANIAVSEPLSGIFAGTVQLDGRTLPAALFASTRRPVLEAHILDFDADLYGKTITITALEKVRDDQTFASLDALKEQIEKDVQSVREYFRVHPCLPEL